MNEEALRSKNMSGGPTPSPSNKHIFYDKKIASKTAFPLPQLPHNRESSIPASITKSHVQQTKNDATQSPSTNVPPLAFPSSRGEVSDENLNSFEEAFLMDKVTTLVRSYHSRIDSSLVPRPLDTIKSSCKAGNSRNDTTRDPISLSLTCDRNTSLHGNTSSLFMRMSLNQIPSTRRIQEASHLPLVTLIQAFPCMDNDEFSIPLVNLNRDRHNLSELNYLKDDEEGPVRCTRCNAYVSPYTQFNDDLSLAACCFCGHTFSVPHCYQLFLADVSSSAQFVLGRKNLKRPELACGVVDYLTPPSYVFPFHRRKENHLQHYVSRDSELNTIPGYCFVIDTSLSAIHSGFTSAAAGAIQYALDTLLYPDITYVSFITYDNNIVFYSFRRPNQYGSDYVQAFVVTDLEKPFVPDYPNNFFASLAESKSQISQFLETFRKRNSNNFLIKHPSSPTSCGNAALASAVSLFQSSKRIGTIHIFYSSHPDIGIGALDKTEGFSNGETSKKHFTFSTSTASFYRELASKMLDNAVSVDVFVASPSLRHIHLNRLTYLSRFSGGSFHYYRNFSPSKDFTQLCYDVARLFQHPRGFNCVFKLRCSRGISVDRAFTLSSTTCSHLKSLQFLDASTFRIPQINSMTTFLFTFKYDDVSMESFRYSYFQFACLHTNFDGQQRIRVVTLAVPLTTSLNVIYRHADVDTLLVYHIRETLNVYINQPDAQWKDQLFSELVNLLLSYRVHCAASSASGQLILPDALKLLPLYVSAILKHPSFRERSDIYRDEKDLYIFRLAHIPLHILLNWIYPRLYVLHRSFTSINGEDLKTFGTYTGIDEQVHSAPTLPLSGVNVSTDGIYLLDNGFAFLLYIGEHVNPCVLKTVFTKSDVGELSGIVDEEHFQGELGERIKRFIRYIKKNKSQTFPYQPLSFIRAKSTQEYVLLQHLVEDRQGSEPPYLDFLCQVHREIRLKLED